MEQRPYQRLIVWKEADSLCLFTYDTTKAFPHEEKFALVQQMRRASYGIPMCIVEGSARKTAKEQRHFYRMALATLEELHYQYSLARRLQYISQPLLEKANDLVKRVSYLLRRLHNAVP